MMGYLIPISEFGYYILFSIITGYVALQFIPLSKKPQIVVPEGILLLCPLGLIVLLFMPILNIALSFKGTTGVLMAGYSAITETYTGRAWIAVCILTLLLWASLYFKRSKWIQAHLILLIIFASGNASHAASLSQLSGGVFHSIHFLMITIWVGILLIVGWFSKGLNNWRFFLRWFSPVAIICFISIVFSGFILMSLVLNDKTYLDTWTIPYGRMLLIKHLSIIPALAFALINGILARRMISNNDFNPKPWIRAECIILFVVFFFTAVLGTFPPPNAAESVSVSADKLTWLDWIIAQGPFSQFNLELSPTLLSAALVLISILFIFLLFVSFKRKTRNFAVLFAGCFIATLYLGLLLSVKPDVQQIQPAQAEQPQTNSLLKLGQ
jgi:copper resistance protein D